MQIPASTYRLQLTSDFNFVRAKAILPYLKALGVSWVYLSPIMQANPGSLHGYDVTNPNQIDQELGGANQFAAFCQTLNQLDMGMLLDFVPSHMAASQYNPWWQDVITQHSSSEYAYLFDIFWDLSTARQLVYRRFFDINELVSLRMEDPLVFTASHQLITQILHTYPRIGIRLDHIDGLKDPQGYLALLKKKLNKPIYTVVEKILAHNEKLPSSWNIAGTTGYDFLNALNQIFIYPIGFKKLSDFYDTWRKATGSVTELRYLNNKLVIARLFKKEFDYLAAELSSIFSAYLNAVDTAEIKNLLSEFCANIPVYRTYINQYPTSTQDEAIIAYIRKTINQAAVKKEYLDILSTLFTATPSETIEQKRWLNWLERWQVFTGPMVAKGYEDTTCYQFNLLLSLNEVGSDPQYFARQSLGNLSDFHAYNQYKQANYAHSLNTTSTHDTKRSEDVRARINVLTEIPDEWQQAALRWQEWNQSQKIANGNQSMPDANDEFMLYQTLLGAWPLHSDKVPLFKQHLHLFLVKATREAKLHSSWQTPNATYEQALLNFCDALLNEGRENKFLTDFIKLQQKVAFFGMLNSLAQTILKIASPGIPDFYQGNEVWQLDLVDPDNRHPIDYEALTQQFNSMRKQVDTDPQFFTHLLDSWPDGQIKLYITYKLLNFRRKYPSFFTAGRYIPITASGSKSEHVISFALCHGNQWLLVVAPRWCSTFCSIGQAPLSTLWEDTKLILPTETPEHWFSVLTAEHITWKHSGLVGNWLSTLLNQLPVGIYINF